MGTRLIVLDRLQVRRRDGVLKVIRVLDIPVCERRKPAGKSAGEFPRRSIESDFRRSDWMDFQEKLLSISLQLTVPQTDTGGRAEYAQALERTREKELGKLTP